MTYLDHSNNIGVNVEWHSSAIFAGERINCVIVFKNNNKPPTVPLHGSEVTSTNEATSSRSFGLPPSLSSASRKTPSLSSPASLRNRQHSLERRSSRDVLPASRDAGDTVSTSDLLLNSTSASPSSTFLPTAGRRAQHGHSRSHSQTPTFSPTQNLPTSPSQRPSSSHKRMTGHSRSLSIVSVTPSVDENGEQITPRRHRRSSSNLNFSNTAREPIPNSASPLPRFRFPKYDLEHPLVTDNEAPQAMNPQKKHVTYDRRESGGIKDEAYSSLNSTNLHITSPRNSGELYPNDNTNNSNGALDFDTPAYPTVLDHPLRDSSLSTHMRRLSTSSARSSLGTAKATETIMMGYAQVHGSFSLDGSLINIEPFESVKNQAVIGSQAGGVIGNSIMREKSGNDSKLFRGFGLSALSSSFSDFFGNAELSSIKEIRGATASNSIPLLSTVQSIIFVDLELTPGESRAFQYSFTLPRGLPPSHRGKVIKISYKLIIGTHQANSRGKETKVRTFEIPFRVLGSVNAYGEVLGHDLMKPYMILRDEAIVKPFSSSLDNITTFLHRMDTFLPSEKDATAAKTETRTNFMSFVQGLVGKEVLNPSSTLQPSLSRRSSALNLPISSAEAIEMAISKTTIGASDQTQNIGASENHSLTRFNIARSGLNVCVVKANRAAYKLGETIYLVADFQNAEVLCYALHLTLETVEQVETSLSLRSAASIQRVTRKVHATSSAVTLYSQRISFTPTIPLSATPEFLTTGVKLEWQLRMEFVIQGTRNHIRTSTDRLIQPSLKADRPSSSTSSRASISGEYQNDDKGEHETLLQNGGSPGINRNELAHEKNKTDAKPPNEGTGMLKPHLQQTSFMAESRSHPLLEPISNDERAGLVLVTPEHLESESFEVVIPLRVYGTIFPGAGQSRNIAH